MAPLVVRSDWFEYESGHAWCESAYKYRTHPYVAEFANTVTNLPLIVLPLVNVYLLRDYIREHNVLLAAPHLVLAFNGLASTGYHATLTLAGQLIDELSLLWLVAAFAAVFAPILPPGSCYPARWHQHASRFRLVTVLLTAGISLLCTIEPNLNACALMCATVPGVMIVRRATVAAGPDVGGPLQPRIFALWTLALGCWIADRWACTFWLSLGAPYLHAVFHVLSSLAAYHLFVMFSYIDIEHRARTKDRMIGGAAAAPRAQLRWIPEPAEKARHPSLFSLPYIVLLEHANE